MPLQTDGGHHRAAGLDQQCDGDRKIAHGHGENFRGSGGRSHRAGGKAFLAAADGQAAGPERGGAGQESVHGGTPGGLSPVI